MGKIEAYIHFPVHRQKKKKKGTVCARLLADYTFTLAFYSLCLNLSVSLASALYLHVISLCANIKRFSHIKLVEFAKKLRVAIGSITHGTYQTK